MGQGYPGLFPIPPASSAFSGPSTRFLAPRKEGPGPAIGAGGDCWGGSGYWVWLRGVAQTRLAAVFLCFLATNAALRDTAAPYHVLRCDDREALPISRPRVTQARTGPPAKSSVPKSALPVGENLPLPPKKKPRSEKTGAKGVLQVWPKCFPNLSRNGAGIRPERAGKKGLRFALDLSQMPVDIGLS